MNSERLGKTLGTKKNIFNDTYKREQQDSSHPNSIVYFSIKPMLDKLKYTQGKENDNTYNKSPIAANRYKESNPYIADKYIGRSIENVSKNQANHSKKSDVVHLQEVTNREDRLYTNQSQRMLHTSHLVIHKDPSRFAYDGKRPVVEVRDTSHTPKNRIEKFGFFPQKDDRSQKKNSSMISSRSYEMMDEGGRPGEDRSTDLRMDESIKNKTLASIHRLMDKSKSNIQSRTNYFADPGVSERRLLPGRQGGELHSPCDSFVFKTAVDASTGNQQIVGSPVHSATRTRRAERSKTSALNRSDMSNGNTSFLTRREDCDASKITGQAAESRQKNGMSKTWVKSALMDSRDDASTISKRDLWQRLLRLGETSVSTERKTKPTSA